MRYGASLDIRIVTSKNYSWRRTLLLYRVRSITSNKKCSHYKPSYRGQMYKKRLHFLDLLYSLVRNSTCVVMSQKNKTPAVILSLLITIAIVGTGIWWFANRSGANTPTPSQPQTPNLPNAPTPKPPPSSLR